MSPELLNPESFGLKDSRPTKNSDCYALGMVILEVLSGRPPFATFQTPTVMWKVMNCERPERPKEVQSEDLWKILEQSWSFQPEERPPVKAILECLEGIPPTIIIDSNEQVQQRSTSHPFSQGEPPSLHEATVQSMEDKNAMGRVGGSGVPSSYWTVGCCPTQTLDQENLAGISGRVCLASLSLKLRH